MEYLLSVQLGAKQWRTKYFFGMEGSIPNPDGNIGSRESRNRIWYRVLKMNWEREYVKWYHGEILPIPSSCIIYGWSVTEKSALV